MKLLAYYNEIDTFCCAWLSNLMDVGVITPGYIDNRSIEDVTPDDVSGYTRVGFFAGIGVWDYALRIAGWPEDRPVWHGSCPCQPFSIAGKGKGTADERHLWPEFARLIGECRPATVFGEQVASKAGRAWLNDVRLDLEALGYGVGAADLCSASIGAPHIRQRLYWVGADTLGDSSSKGLEGCRGLVQKPAPQRRKGEIGYNPTASGAFGLAHTKHQGWDNLGLSYCRGNNNRDRGITTQKCDGELGRIRTDSCEDCNSPVRLELPCADNRLANTTGEQEYQEQQRPSENESWRGADESGGCSMADAGQYPGPTNGFWRDADWLFCRDGKWRPTQSIVVEMADGLADRLGYSRFGDRWSLNPLIQKAENRVGRLKGYGNAINAEQAEAFIEAFMDVSA